MKVTLNEVGDLSQTTTAKATINTNFEAIEDAIENTLSRDGTTPNTMSAPLDMNSQPILNLPVPGSNHEPVRVSEFQEAVLGQPLSLPFHISNTTQSTSTSTGSFVADGGMGIGKDLYIGGTLHVGTFTASPTELDFQGSTSGMTVLKPSAVASGTVTLPAPAVSDMLVGRATTDTLTNKTFDTAGAGNSFSINGVAATANTGTGAVVRATSPTLITPALGTPASGVATNLTGTAAGLTAGNVTTNANLTGPITSVGNATSIASQTGTGTKFVVDTSPVLVTPTLGVATATSINKVAITAPASSATLTIPDGVTLTGPAASGTAMTLGNAETVSGVKSFNSGTVVHKGSSSGTTTLQASATASGTLTLPAATDTLVGKATTDTLTNKTFDTAGTGNSFSINGVAANANTGTGSVVRATSPTLVTPVLGAATATTINGVTLDNNAWSTYTPTSAFSTPGSGVTFGASGNGARYKQIGKIVYFLIDWSITAIGSGGNGAWILSLPVTGLNGSMVASASGKEVVTIGALLSIGASDATHLTINKYDNTTLYVGGTGTRIQIGGFYEAA